MTDPTDHALVPVTPGSSTFEVLPYAARLAEAIHRTEFVPSGLRGNAEKVAACILAGHELGIEPMQSLRSVHVIQGRTALSAELQRALVLREGHELWVEESNNTRVTVVGQRKGSSHPTKVTFTMEDAKRAKLDGKDTWRAYPRAMMLARATSELVRMLFPDVVAGFGLSAEEAADLDPDLDPWIDPAAVDGDGEPEEAPPAKRKATNATAKKRTTTRKAAPPRAPAAAATPPPAPPLPGEEPDDVVDVEEGPDGVLAVPGDEQAAEEVPERLAKLRQRIAIGAKEQDVDRAELVYAATFGVHTGASELNESQAEHVLEVLRLLKTGEVRLVVDENGAPQLEEAPPAENGEEAPSEPEEAADGDTGGPEAEWSLEEWQRFLRERKVRLLPVLTFAKGKAADLEPDGPVPSGLGDLKGRPELAAVVRAEVERLAGA